MSSAVGVGSGVGLSSVAVGVGDGVIAPPTGVAQALKASIPITRPPKSRKLVAVTEDVVLRARGEVTLSFCGHRLVRTASTPHSSSVRYGDGQRDIRRRRRRSRDQIG
ncbi:hypothetical protein CI089_02820 [Microbacterium sp. Yaish 1]|nr:hypothetical protein CI089_02820 [Microbacterium sp. Yaish 1]